MTIKEQLLHNELQNKATAMAVTKQAAASKEQFDELMLCFLSNSYLLVQRAAWCVSHAVSLNVQQVYPYIKDLVAQLLRRDVHDAVIRNSVRILKAITIPEEYHGEVMNACFILAEKVETPIAVKAFSLSTLFNLYKLYPDIGNELEAAAEAGLQSESAAVKSVCRKIIAALHKSKSPRVHHKPAEVNNHSGKHNRAAGKKTNGAYQSQ